jgi:predicted membrane protein
MIQVKECGMAEKRVPPVALRLAFGFGVMAIGLLLTLDNFGLLQSRRFIRFWPVLLIVGGLAKLSLRLRSHARPAGMFMVVLGVVLLLVNLGALQPRLAVALFLLVVGAAMVSRAKGAPVAISPAPRLDAGRQLDVSTFMGSVQRAMSAQDFRGGHASAVMGVCEIDLTKASIEAEEVVVDVFTFWGGVELKVPADWMVESRGTALLGAFEDTSRPPDTVHKKLIVTGIAVMGGVEVKN